MIVPPIACPGMVQTALSRYISVVFALIEDVFLIASDIRSKLKKGVICEMPNIEILGYTLNSSILAIATLVALIVASIAAVLAERKVLAFIGTILAELFLGFLFVILVVPNTSGNVTQSSSLLSQGSQEPNTSPETARTWSSAFSPSPEPESKKSKVDTIIEEASQVFLPNGEYILARNIILSGLTEYPSNTELLGELDYYKSFEPIRFSEMYELMSEGGAITTYTVKRTDNLGTVYESYDYVLADYDSGLFVSSDRKKVATTYMINGKYTNFYGTIVLDDIHKNTDLVGLIRVLGDGVILLEQGGITKGFLPVDFNIDLTGVRQLVVEFEGYDQLKSLIVNSYLVNNFLGFSAFIRE